MENASKALVIAGTILISILLITIGILLINSAKNVADSGKNAMSSSAIQAFNSQFTPYEGTGKSAKEINQLLDIIISSNASNSNQIAIKLLINNFDIYLVVDSANFACFSESGKKLRSSTGKIESINNFKKYINNYPSQKYSVTLWYANEYTVKKSGHNKNLNPIIGCIMAIDIISENF